MRAIIFVALSLSFCNLGSAEALAWRDAAHLPYPATAQCMGENLCLFVSCPLAGEAAFELLLNEHGKATGEPFDVIIDGRRFTFALPVRNERELYRWPLAEEFANSLIRGRSAHIALEAVGTPVVLPLNGSGSAISALLSTCTSHRSAASNGAVNKRLTGLSPETDCETASSTGQVVDRTLKPNGKAIEGFRFKDKYGVGYINVDPPQDRDALQEELLELIVPGATLRLEVHGCGAAARIEVLSAIERLR